ncbi:MAG: hypothetical protein ABC612_05590 [Candidatus Methanosuratincola petrocarbonis]
MAEVKAELPTISIGLWYWREAGAATAPGGSWKAISSARVRQK